MALGLVRGDVFLIVAAIVLPIAGIAFALVGPRLRELGKGTFGVEFEHDLDQSVLRDSDADGAAETREEEIRQLVEAKAFRQAARGETPLNIEAEVEKLMTETPAAGRLDDPALVEEVRQHVVARNERRKRRGEEPLDVDSEISRQLRELENLGQ